MTFASNPGTGGGGSRAPWGSCNSWHDALRRRGGGRGRDSAMPVTATAPAGEAARFLVAPLTGPAKASRRSQLSSPACSAGCLPAPRSGFGLAWIFMCSRAGFQCQHLSWVSWLLLKAPRPEDAADNAAGRVRATLPRGAGSRRLLWMPGPGSESMSSKRSRALPRPCRQK